MNIDFIKKNMLPISIFLSALMISTALIIHGLSNRYEFVKDSVPLFDKLTGTTYYFSNSSFYKFTKNELNNAAMRDMEDKSED